MPAFLVSALIVPHLDGLSDDLSDAMVDEEKLAYFSFRVNRPDLMHQIQAVEKIERINYNQ